LNNRAKDQGKPRFKRGFFVPLDNKIFEDWKNGSNILRFKMARVRIAFSEIIHLSFWDL